MGVQLGSTGAARLQEYFGSTLFSTAARIACIAVVILLLFGGTRQLLARHTAVRGIVLTSALQLVCVAIAWALDPSARFALGVACTVAEGAGLALLMYLVLDGAIELGTHTAAAVVACGYLIVNVWDAFFVGASQAVCTAQWIAGIVIVPALTLSWARGERKLAPASPQAEVASIPSPMSQPLVQFSAPVLCLATILLATGVFVNLTGVGGTGENAFFDLSVNIYLILVRVAVVAFVAAWPRLPSPIGVAAFGICGFALGTGMVVVLWDTSEQFLGAMAIESTLYALQTLILVAGVEVARQNPAHHDEVILATIGLDFANHITRLLTPFFAHNLASVTGHVAGSVAAVSLGCVAACAAWGWVRATAPGRSNRTSGGADAQGEADPILARELVFYRTFCATAARAHLTDREREVLYEAMHGYSADHIAERLAVSSQTVKTYLSRAYQKLGVRTKQEALRLLDDAEPVESLSTITTGTTVR